MNNSSSPPPAAANEKKAGGEENGDVERGVVQSGVAIAEAVARSWTMKWLLGAYGCILAMAVATSFSEQVSYLLTPFATSGFGHHSMLSTISVIGSVLNAVFQPPVAKIADVFGRKEGFLFSTLLYCLGYTLSAVSHDIETFSAARVFEAAGITGLKMMQQIFIADTSDLSSRLLIGSIPDLPFIFTVWAAPSVAEGLRGSSANGWRWGYGMWALVTPVFIMPFIGVLWYHKRRSGVTFATASGPAARKTLAAKVLGIALDLDMLGTLCLTGGFGCLLVPLTIAANQPDSWRTPGIVASLVIGGVLLIGVFPALQSSRKLCPTPIVPRRALKNPTVLAGMVLAFFYFMAFFLSIQPYFYSYMMVTRQMDAQIAGYIMNTFSVSCSITVLAVGVAMRFVKRWKPFLYVGIVLYTLGIGLMLMFRNTEASVVAIVFTQLIVGVGGGFVNGPAQVGLQASCEHSEVATATALFLTTLSLGGAVGSAISGAVWTAGVKGGMEKYLPEHMKGQVAELFGDMTKAAALAAGSPEKLAVDRAYDETMFKLVCIALGMCAPLLPAAWFMKDVRLDQEMRDGQVVFGNLKGKKSAGVVDEKSGETESDSGSVEPVQEESAATQKDGVTA